MPRVRGRLLTPARAFAKEVLGEKGWERVLLRLPPGDRQIVDGLILSEGWYEIGVWSRFNLAIRDEIGDAMSDAFHHLGRKAAEMNVPLFHRMLMKFGSPATVFARAAALWKEYFDEGRMEVIERGDNHYRIMLYDDIVEPWFPSDMLPGWATKVVEMTGHEVVAARLVAIHESKPACYEMYVEWR